MCAAECAGADVKYVAHPACEELAGERALQEVRAGVGASGDARELEATGGERTLRAAEVHL